MLAAVGEVVVIWPVSIVRIATVALLFGACQKVLSSTIEAQTYQSHQYVGQPDRGRSRLQHPQQ